MKYLKAQSDVKFGIEYRGQMVRIEIEGLKVTWTAKIRDAKYGQSLLADKGTLNQAIAHIVINACESIDEIVSKTEG